MTWTPRRCCRIAGISRKIVLRARWRLTRDAINQVLIRLMHDEYRNVRGGDAVALQDFPKWPRGFCGPLEDHGQAVHLERRVEAKLQIVGKSSVGMKYGIDDTERAFRRSQEASPAPSPNSGAMLRSAGARVATEDIFSAATIRTLP